MNWNEFCWTSWKFDQVSRTVEEARELLRQQIVSLNPRVVISIQEKEDEIVCWMVL